MARLRDVRPIQYTVESVRFRLVREGTGPVSARIVSSPAAVVDAIRDTIGLPDDCKEHFFALYLDAKNGLRYIHEISMGTLSASLVHAREVFGPAMRLMGVASLILVHNHPSGDPNPSMEDVRLTKQMVDAGKLLDLHVHDHVILGDGTGAWVSLAERGAI